MAIKDAVLREVLNVKSNILNNNRYRRLREVESVPNWKKTGAILESELESNRSQTGVILESKLESNRSHTGVILESNRSHTGVILESKLESNRSQTEDKNVGDKSYSSLSGLQLKITHFIYEHCKAHRSKITQPLSIEYIALSCKINSFSIKKAIQRLEKKGILIRRKYKVGRNGWTCYELPDVLYKEILHAEENTKLESDPESNCPSSSSLYIKKTTTTRTEDEILSAEWKHIDLEPLQEIGFTYQHLSQLAKQGKLSVQIIQNSIYAFAFDLKRNGKASKIKGSPLNYFMGILRNSQPYAFPANYESPQHEAMRLYIEREEAIQQKRQTLEARVAELAFNKWLEEEVTEEEKRKIISPSIYCLQAKAPKRAELRDHFMKVVWPEKRKALLEGINEKGVEGF